MSFPLLACAILAGLLALWRLQATPAVQPARVTSSALSWALAYVCALGFNAPLLGALPELLTADSTLVSDAATHALAAQALVDGGWQRGWIDGLAGGFPVGPHYPTVSWAIAALGIALGVPAALMVQLLVAVAVLITPLLVVWTARALRLHPIAAALAAGVIATVQPLNSFVGGYEAFYRMGLLNQVLAIPVAVWLVRSIAVPTRAWQQSASAALLMLIHPQVGVAVFAILGILVVAIPERLRGLCFALCCVAGAAFGLAVFGPGLSTLKVPFGWPEMETWRVTGFDLTHITAWLAEGFLLDDGRLPVLTNAWLLALVLALFSVQHKSSRAVCIASVATVLLSGVGAWVQTLGHLGEALLAFYQPLRMLCVLPLVAAASVAVGFDRALHTTASVLRDRPGWPAWGRHTAWLLIPLFALLTLPSRAHWFHGYIAARALTPEGGECSALNGRARVTHAKQWLQALPHGRLEYDIAPPLSGCMMSRGVFLGAPVVLGATHGVGAHVGLLSMTFKELHPTAPGADQRAESLGIRHFLHHPQHAPVPSERWQIVEQSPSLVLSKRSGGTDLVGAGCVTQEVRGSNRELFAWVRAHTQGPVSLLSNPQSLTRLVEVPQGSLQIQPVAAGECDSSAVTIEEQSGRHGLHEARVTSASAFDLIVRSTAFPTWKVTVDGAPAETFRVAPGWFAVRVPAGHHRVHAEVGPLPGYLLGLLLALVGVAACTWQFERRINRENRR